MDLDAIPATASDDDSWSITASTTAQFRVVADTACSILMSKNASPLFNVDSECKEKCRFAKLQGSCDALCDFLNRLKDRGAHEGELPFDIVNQECSHLLATRKAACPDESAAQMPSFSAEAEPSVDGAREDGGDIFVDPEFRAGCLAFTQYFKGILKLFISDKAERTKEIRLAHAIGYRNALLELLNWAVKTRHPETFQG